MDVECGLQDKALTAADCAFTDAIRKPAHRRPRMRRGDFVQADSSDGYWSTCAGNQYVTRHSSGQRSLAPPGWLCWP
jgi:hypothetical protein